MLLTAFEAHQQPTRGRDLRFKFTPSHQLNTEWRAQLEMPRRCAPAASRLSRASSHNIAAQQHLSSSSAMAPGRSANEPHRLGVHAARSPFKSQTQTETSISNSMSPGNLRRRMTIRSSRLQLLVMKHTPTGTSTTCKTTCLPAGQTTQPASSWCAGGWTAAVYGILTVPDR